jgi:HEAT repeat protein
LAFIIASDFVADMAWWAGFSLTMTAVFCILFMLFFRNFIQNTRQKDELVLQEWEKIIFDNIAVRQVKPIKFWSSKKTKSKHPKADKWKDISPDCRENKKHTLNKNLIKEELPSFLYSWNYIHSSLKGEAKISLNELGNNLDLEDKAIKMLKSLSLKNRLSAIEALGNLRSEKAFPELNKLSKHRDSIISLMAVRSLLQINFKINSRKFLPLIAVREDWSPPVVAEMLKRQGSDEISEILVKLVETCYEQKLKDRQLSRLISYLSLGHPNDYVHLINKILSESTKTEVVIACLRLVHTDEMLPKVRSLLKDERWQIRMQVVLTLGRLGNEEDVDRLVFSLNDLDWWVRYRSAGALISMPAVSYEYVENLAKTLPNQFSRDILNHVLAEIRMGCLIQPSSFTLSK